MKSKWNVGDKVVVVNSEGFYDMYLGQYGVVKETDDSRLPVLVQFPNGDSDWGHDSDLEFAHDDSTDAKLRDAAINLENAKREYAKLLDIAMRMHNNE